jgi:cytochrome c oxidase assembly protein Cox11
MGAKKLNKLQLHFLQFFLDRDIDDNETEQIKQVIAQYYFDKAEKEIENVIIEKGITNTSIENLKNQHLRTKFKD